MHSPLNSKVIIKLPLSVSLINGEPSYMMLDKALNGLREGSISMLATTAISHGGDRRTMA